MTVLKRIGAAILDGVRWLLLCIATIATTAADAADDAAAWLRR